MSQYLNPLHTPEWIETQIRFNGRFDLTRRTGRSTAQALKLIAEAIENPYTNVTIKDHSVPGVPDYQLKEHIAHRVRVVCEKLELKHMHINKIGGEYKLSFGKV